MATPVELINQARDILRQIDGYKGVYTVKENGVYMLRVPLFYGQNGGDLPDGRWSEKAIDATNWYSFRENDPEFDSLSTDDEVVLHVQTEVDRIRAKEDQDSFFDDME